MSLSFKSVVLLFLQVLFRWIIQSFFMQLYATFTHNIIKRYFSIAYRILNCLFKYRWQTTMATGSKKPEYTGDDKVDEWLLNQVVEHINHDRIGSFAAELRVERSVYSSIPGDKDKTFKVRDMQVEESLYFNIATVIIWPNKTTVCKIPLADLGGHPRHALSYAPKCSLFFCNFFGGH